MEQTRMEQNRTHVRIHRGLILMLWGVACCIAAFFIPHYDFGFDGVKVWFFLCLLMLAGLIGGASLFQTMHRNE
jgi:fatty acid desaturase